MPISNAYARCPDDADSPLVSARQTRAVPDKTSKLSVATRTAEHRMGIPHRIRAWMSLDRRKCSRGLHIPAPNGGKVNPVTRAIVGKTRLWRASSVRSRLNWSRTATKKTRDDARASLFDHMEVFYNCQR